MEKETNAASLKLLEAMYKNVRMGADSIIDIMPKVADKALRAELTSELERYEEFSKEIEQYILNTGKEAKDQGILERPPEARRRPGPAPPWVSEGSNPANTSVLGSCL